MDRKGYTLRMGSGKVKRWHTTLNLHPQNVGEHSYGVAQTLRYITEDNCTVEQLRQALDHDAAELLTGDLPHPTKRKMKEIAAVVQQMEEAIEEEYGLVCTDEPLVAVADLLEMGIYGVNEVTSGNFHFMPVLENVVIALGEHMELLEQYPRALNMTKEIIDYVEARRRK